MGIYKLQYLSYEAYFSSKKLAEKAASLIHLDKEWPEVPLIKKITVFNTVEMGKEVPQFSITEHSV